MSKKDEWPYCQVCEAGPWYNEQEIRVHYERAHIGIDPAKYQEELKKQTSEPMPEPVKEEQPASLEDFF